MTPIKHIPYAGNLTSVGLERPDVRNYSSLTGICANIRRMARDLGHDMSLWTDHDILSLEDVCDDEDFNEILNSL